MSIRLKKQLWRKAPGGEKDWIPGPGQYKLTTGADIGHTKSRFQEWKAPIRKTDWCIRKTEMPDTMINLMDHKGLAKSLSRSVF